MHASQKENNPSWISKSLLQANNVLLWICSLQKYIFKFRNKKIACGYGANLVLRDPTKNPPEKQYVFSHFSGVCHLSSGKEDADLISVSLCVHNSMPRNSYRLNKCTHCIATNKKKHNTQLLSVYSRYHQSLRSVLWTS